MVFFILNSCKQILRVKKARHFYGGSRAALSLATPLVFYIIYFSFSYPNQNITQHTYLNT